jgi:5-methylcytosine-specific restriction endonuclease McrA
MLKTCKKCQREKPLNEFSKHKDCKYGVRPECKDCNNKQQRIKYETNEAHRENCKRLASEWGAGNRARKNENSKAWIDLNRERWNEIQRNSYHKKIKHHRKRWQIISQRKRARVREVGGDFSASEWEDVKRKYNYTCLCCGATEPDTQLTIDHVVPISKGGPNSKENIQPLCLSCNSRKNANTVDYR